MSDTDILRRYLQYTGFAQQHIEGYDYWLENIAYGTVASRYLQLKDSQIPEQLRNAPLPDDLEFSDEPDRYQNWVITFEDLEIRPPSYHRAQSPEALLMTPQLARQEGLTYGCDWYVVMTLRRGGVKGSIVGNQNQRVLIGNVPLMVKSKYCVLHGKNARELEMLGEDPVDPGGYFIIEGTEKVILMQEQLALNRILLMRQKLNEPAVIRIITSTIKGTAMNEIILRRTQKESKDNNVLVMRLPSIRHEDPNQSKINVLRIYRILNIDNAEDIINYLNLFIPVQERPKCLYKLSRSLMDFHSAAAQSNILPRDDDIEYLAYSLNIPNASTSEKERAISVLFDNDLFPHLNNLPPLSGESLEAQRERIYTAKISLLSLMIARYLRYLAGYIQLDDRDSWSNKRLKGAGPMMDQLFRNAWRTVLKQLQGTIETTFNYIDLPTLQKKLAKDLVTDSYRSSFVTPNWGVKNSIISNNVAQTLVRDSLIASIGHLYTIDVPISRKDRQAEPRLVQQSQFGFVDPIATPEGANTGIIKNLSLTGRISVDHDDTIVIRYLLEAGLIQGVYTPYGSPSGTIPGQDPTTDVPMPTDKLVLNGKFLGWCDAAETHNFLLSKRRNASLLIDMSIIRQDDYIYVDMSSSRLLRPLLIVDIETQTLVIAQKNLWQASIPELLSEGAMEYISPWEQEYIKLAITSNDIADRLQRIEDAQHSLIDAETNLAAVRAGETVNYGSTVLDEDSAVMNLRVAQTYLQQARNVMPYTHCELDTISMLGVVSALIPWPNHNQAPRNTYQVSMGKQAQGIYHRNHVQRYDGSMKMLVYPTNPMVYTEMYELIGLKERPAGENVVIAFMAWPYTEEDSFVFKREFLQNGGFRMFKYFVLKTTLRNTNTSSEKLARPEVSAEDAERYRYIGSNGLPAIGAYLRPGDCVVAKYIETRKEGRLATDRRLDPTTGKFVESTRQSYREYSSLFMAKGEEGVVDGVKITRSGQDTTIIEIKMRTMRIPQEGDKFAPRNAQKGTIGLVVSSINLPVSSSGITPDIIVNVHSIPSRMTIEYLMELLSSKHGAMRGVRVNGTAFRPFDMNEMRQTMKDYNLHEFGYEKVRSGMTGQPLQALIFMGPVYFQALRHHVKDKIQARGQGPSTSMFHQPTKGRSNGGGLRFGEMERDALASFGATSALLERLKDVSDAYPTVMCRRCGTFALHRPIDGDYICPLCESKGLGSEIGKVTIPYVLKLFMNLLSATGIQLQPQLWNAKQEERQVFGSTRVVEEDLDVDDDTRLEIEEDLENALEKPEDIEYMEGEMYDADLD